ncbi:MAG: zinc ribbon domain-containing protein [Ruminococcus callidus]|nr:zinc ribbon domain-containing protein [Ruminococcus callidus]
MRIRKQFGCAVLAAAMCFCSLQLPADADALDPGQWFVCEEFEINCDGVMGYSWKYIEEGGEQEIEYCFQKGDIVYARTACHTMGIDWVTCYNIEPHEEGAVFYGWVDMTYLSPIGSVVEEPEPEPEPEPVETEPPTDPPTEAPTTVVTTIATTAVTTIFTTLAPTEAETTMLTTTTTTQQTDAAMSIIDNQNDDHKNDFFSDNFTLLLIGGIVVLLAGSGALAIGLMQHNKKKQMFLPNSQNGQGFVGVHFCPQCGMRNPKTAAFCKKCGKPMK